MFSSYWRPIQYNIIYIVPSQSTVLQPKQGVIDTNNRIGERNEIFLAVCISISVLRDIKLSKNSKHCFFSLSLHILTFEIESREGKSWYNIFFVPNSLILPDITQYQKEKNRGILHTRGCLHQREGTTSSQIMQTCSRTKYSLFNIHLVAVWCRILQCDYSSSRSAPLSVPANSCRRWFISTAIG